MERKRVCFSGHRPDGFGLLAKNGFSNSDVVMCIQSGLYDLIRQSICDGYLDFISGMAPGVDFWAAKLVLEVSQREFPWLDVRLIAALPYPGFAVARSGPLGEEFERVLKSAYSVVHVSPHYSKQCFFHRNKYMIDNSDRLIAVVVDYKSGTGQTIRLAEKRGIEIVKLDLDECVKPYTPPDRSV